MFNHSWLSIDDIKTIEKTNSIDFNCVYSFLLHDFIFITYFTLIDKFNIRVLHLNKELNPSRNVKRQNTRIKMVFHFAGENVRMKSFNCLYTCCDWLELEWNRYHISFNSQKCFNICIYEACVSTVWIWLMILWIQYGTE